MIDFLLMVSIVFACIVLIGYLNEKLFGITYEIALLIGTTIIGTIIALVWASVKNTTLVGLMDTVQVFDLKEFLMEGVLCFMLFAGARNMKIREFQKHARSVTVLAFVCTLLGALFYGLLFFLMSNVMHLNFTLPMCLMAGSIIAPTDPIAATSILKKFHLPHEVGFLMEAESLLNDGVGVALFVCFSGMVTSSGSGSFLILMGREVLGAAVIGFAVSWLTFQIFQNSQDIQRKIFTSIFAVSLSYYLCECFGCSGAIACVVCGVTFSALRDNAQSHGKLKNLKDFDSFWETGDVLLNSVLYVIMGLTFIRILWMEKVIRLSFVAIVLNFVCRYASVFLGSFILGPLPKGYDHKRFAMLFTWGALRGGLSLALAMSTKTMVPESQYHIILGTVYAVVFFTTVVQGQSMKKMYQSLSGVK